VLKLLALDFDGVISDSAPESFVVALRTWAEMRPDSQQRHPRSLLSGPVAPDPAEIPRDPLYRDFLAMMPLGNRAEDYGVELLALEGGLVLTDQASYDAFKAEVDPVWLRAFHKRFYGVRTAMAEADRPAWNRLMAPYPGIPELLRRRAGDLVLAIATSKDRASVAKLLASYGIDDLFPPGFVLDKEAGASKRAHFERLHGSTRLSYQEMLFIDDKVNHLDSVAALGVRCGLAGWGYNSERERCLARDAGHMIFEMGDLEQQIFEGV
jgi:phosphoglycolate phosphatase-like HAD superfamily hydrolase